MSVVTIALIQSRFEFPVTREESRGIRLLILNKMP